MKDFLIKGRDKIKVYLSLGMEGFIISDQNIGKVLKGTFGEWSSINGCCMENEMGNRIYCVQWKNLKISQILLSKMDEINETQSSSVTLIYLKVI